MKTLESILSHNPKSDIGSVILDKLIKADPWKYMSMIGNLYDASLLGDTLSFRSRKDPDGPNGWPIILLNDKQRRILEEFKIAGISCPDPIVWYDYPDTSIKNIQLIHPGSMVCIQKNPYTNCIPDRVEDFNITCGGLRIDLRDVIFTRNKWTILGKPRVRYQGDRWEGLLCISDCWKWKNNQVEAPVLDIQRDELSGYVDIEYRLMQKSESSDNLILSSEILSVAKLDKPILNLKRIYWRQLSGNSFILDKKSKDWWSVNPLSNRKK